MALIIEIGSLLSRFFNVAVGGEANMNLSARAHIEAREGSVRWRRVEQFIDALFFWQDGHCAEVWQNRVFRAADTLDRDERAHEFETMKARAR